jgi:hypothetical protein
MSPGKSNKLPHTGVAGDRPPPLATDEEFCEFTGLTSAQSAQLRYLGRGPKFIRVTGRQIRYEWAEIERWVKANSCTKASERYAGADA